MNRQNNTILWLGWALLIPALIYSLPRLYCLPEVRYDRIVVERLKNSPENDIEHIKRHQALVDKMAPEAIKGGVVLILVLCFLSYGLQSTRKKM